MDDAQARHRSRQTDVQPTQPRRPVGLGGDEGLGLDEDDMREIARVICAALSDAYDDEREELRARTRALADAHPLYPQLSAATV